MIAGASTTIAVTSVQPPMAAGNPTVPSGSKASASSAMRSPSAKVAATAAASSRQQAAKPESDAGRSRPISEYNSPPRPMPASATASTSPKVKTDPPSSGPRSRYQTSSIRKNAKPTVADAIRRKEAGGAGGAGRA